MVPIQRRNFLLTFILNFILWGGVVYLVNSLSPNKDNIILFFFAFTLALTLTLALIFGNTRRGFLLTLFIDGFLLLQLTKLTSLLNLSLLFIILSVSEFYFSHRKTNI